MNPRNKKQEKLNILFLAVAFPWPMDAGIRRRTYAAASFLARHHRVTLYGFSKNQIQMDKHFRQMSSCFERVRIFPISRSERIRRMLLRLFSPLPWHVNGFQSPEMKSALLKDFKNFTWDIVYAMDINMAPFIFSIPARLRVVDFDICYSKYFQTIINISAPPLLRPFIFLEFLKMRRYERLISRLADRCFISSNLDRDIISEERDRAKWFVLPNIADTNFFSFSPPARNHRLIFVGRMSYLPNKQAALHFCRNILPLIRREVPDVELYIVGSNPPPIIKQLDNDNFIRVTGTVPDMRPYLNNSAALICPVRMGGGTRLKILEAMASGVPVVSTTFGCEGLNAIPGEEILVADQNDKFSQSVISILNDPERASIIARKARCLIENKFSQNVVERCLIDGLNLPAGIIG